MLGLADCCRLVLGGSGSLRVAASEGSQSGAGTEEKGAKPQRIPKKLPPMPPGMDPNLELVRVEDLKGDAVSGVGFVKNDANSTDVGRVALLVAGDVAAFLIFAAIGRANHGEGNAVAEVVGTALPFILGWLATSPLTGAYSEDAQKTQDPLNAWLITGKSWIAGVPVGLVLRGVAKGRVPPKPFIIVAMVATLVLLGGWRSFLASKTIDPRLNPKAAAAAKENQGNKKGNVFEMFELIGSLTKRW
ncbi:unnamed protein product [Pedinophyceae sp. YPF-701]|nr:unnamed protein product [Pedinophyceae sp. YPF-701]